MTDAFGNYICGIEPAPAPYPPSSRCCGSGEGAPDDANGTDGQTYVDTLTGAIYTKAGGFWTIVSGGTGATEVYFITGDPNGVVTAARPALAYDAAGAIWIKTGSGSSNTGWEQRL